MNEQDLRYEGWRVAGASGAAQFFSSFLVYSFAVLGLARERLVRAAAALVDHGVRVVLYAEPEYGEHGLIVTPPGISKWSGVEAWCRLAGIGAADVLAVGDGDNDVEMLHHAGVGVAVRGGTRAALDVADHVIDPPHDHGWATLLELVDGG